MNYMKKIKVILSVFIITILIFFFLCPIINDYTSKQVTEDLLQVPLPEKTDVIEEFSRSGKLEGNGNGMQFFGAILIQSDLSLDELNEYYTDYRKTQWDYIVEEQNTQSIDVIEHGYDSFNAEVASQGYYIVYSWGKGLPPFEYFDLRGN